MTKNFRRNIERIFCYCGDLQTSWLENFLKKIPLANLNNRGHSKSTWVEGEKKNPEIFKMNFYSYSSVFAIDYNGSMKH